MRRKQARTLPRKNGAKRKVAEYGELVSDQENIEEESPDLAKLQAAVSAEISDAVDYVDTQLSPSRAVAIDYYKSELFGSEQDGSSDYVSSDVRDTILGMMPNLMRIFAGAERICEYVPASPEDIGLAEQATDVIDYIFQKRNDGYGILYSTFKDALVSGLGIVKFWHEEQRDVETYEFSGLSENEIMLLAQDPDVLMLEQKIEIEARMEEGADGQPMMIEPPQFGATVKRLKMQQQYNVASVPPEEFLIARKAVDLETSSVVAHRQIKTVSELVAMGYDFELVVQYSSVDDSLEQNEERFARNPEEDFSIADRPDDGARSVLYCESYIRFDLDGDGISERLKVCTLGGDYFIVNVEPIADLPFSIFCPDPEPHTIVGLSEADKVKDIQESKSEIMRDMLDSLAQSIHPRTAVVEGQANMDDVLSNETGGIIRMRAPGMVQPFSQPFVGQAAFPMLQYLDSVREERSGVSKASMGLNADALQSATRAAVAATIQGSQARIELIARTFAETGMKRLFKGLLKVVTAHQDIPMIVRLRNTFVEVDPRTWNADMDVEINIALAGTTTEERMQSLGNIAAKQQEIIGQMGPNNPIVNLSQYRNTLAKMVELSGFKDASAFFSEVPADFEFPEPAENEKPSPEEMLAQVQMESIRADIEKKAADLQLQREKMLRDDDRQRDKLDADIALRAAEIKAKHGAQIDTALIRADLERDREAERILAQERQAMLERAVQQQNQAIQNQAIQNQVPQV